MLRVIKKHRFMECKRMERRKSMENFTRGGNRENRVSDFFERDCNIYNISKPFEFLG